MIKLLIKHKIAETAIETLFNTLIRNFTPAPVMNGIMEVAENGARRWLLHGELHRVDGPAVESNCGYNSWWLNGKQHRVGGPAFEYYDGAKSWYLNGNSYTEKEYWKQLR